ncbi:MAG: EAL domain-containing protein [Sulfuricurvum sp.]|nr:EAL domain-containing protein [Sulfuricurvum sp.]
MLSKDLYSFKNAFLTSLIYFIFAILWIYFSDNLVEIISSSRHEMHLIQTYKGFFFVLITSILLFFLMFNFLSLQHKEYVKHLQTLEQQSTLEESIQLSNEMYRALFENMLDSVAHCRMIYDNGVPVDFEYLNVNAIFESMTGLHDPIGRNVSDFIPQYAQENPDSLAIFNEIALGGAPRKWEHYLKALNKWFSFSLYSLKKGEFIVIAADITERKQSQILMNEEKERYDYIAHHDLLTNLPNRFSLIEMLQKKISHENSDPFALLFLDLDGFKEINDSYGHPFGDRLLIKFTHLLQKVFTHEMVIVRTGGDEFLILMPTIDQQFIQKKIRSLMKKMSVPFIINQTEVYITASIGIAFYPENGISMEEILKNADTAMYNAKKMGKNTYSFYDNQFTHEILEKTIIYTNLKKALSTHELQLYFQPQIEPETEKVIGVEALIRWFSGNESIPPSLFIPIAEERGLIIDIGTFVLEEGFLTASRWYKEGILPNRIAINVSARQLIHPHFMTLLNHLLNKTHCNPEWIELEITESSILENPEKMIALLTKIKNKGFHISIDDFGTGYSSLSYLKNLPIDKLKIDISFIRNITYEPKNQTIVKAIIALAKGLGLSVLAEGVEMVEELTFLQQNAIDSIQGFYYHKPMDSKKIEALLKTQ